MRLVNRPPLTLRAVMTWSGTKLISPSASIMGMALWLEAKLVDHTPRRHDGANAGSQEQQFHRPVLMGAFGHPEHHRTKTATLAERRRPSAAAPWGSSRAA